MIAFAAFFVAAASLVDLSGGGARVFDPRPDANLGVTFGIDGQRLLSRFTDCAVEHERPRVLAYLAAPPGSRVAKRHRNVLKGGYCNQNIHLYFSDVLFRGALYESLYLKDFAGREPVDLTKVSTSRSITSATASGEARTSAALRAFGECVVRVDATNVRGLLATQIGSAREAAAFSALAPALSQCLSPDQRIEFDKPSLRGYLAEGVYSLSVAASGQADGGGA